ncbi:MAG TPA: choice-of-anchor Q domain-containing protein [Rhodanobacteraceae bacterium]|nr:choice-of-anchor Q domain-containing protein [Rhodanobacteraceae bacterium]
MAGNTAPNADPSRADLILLFGSTVGDHNLIVAAAGVTLPSDTISADPLLGPLQDNGGPTLTHALLPGSPAIDAGANFRNFQFDQRGNGFPRSFGIAPDIGAFERTITTSTCYGHWSLPCRSSQGAANPAGTTKP